MAGEPGQRVRPRRADPYAEVLWYANADPLHPREAADRRRQRASRSLLASLTVAAPSGTDLPGTYAPDQTAVRGGWTDVGVLLDTPAATLTALPVDAHPGPPPAAPAGTATMATWGRRERNGTTVAATPPPDRRGDCRPGRPGREPCPQLQAPLRDAVGPGHGQPRQQRARGSCSAPGTHSAPGQDFTLAKAPVTYLSDRPAAPATATPAPSTLAVDGRYWSEVPALYGHRPDEAIFVTYEDDDGKTHVRFGDGETGARLPSGATVTAGLPRRLRRRRPGRRAHCHRS